MSEHIRARIVQAFSEVLGPDLTAIYVYGSATDGSFLAGFSDFDVAVFCHGRPALDAYLAVYRHLADVQLDPFDYLQVKYIDVTAPPKHELVPGAFELLCGGLIDEKPYVFTDESLRAESKRWLSIVPGLLAEDAQTWSVAVGPARRRRHVRLIVTRIKPTVRGLLTVLGESPAKAFTATWDDFPSMMASHDQTAASQLADLRPLLPPSDPEAESRVAELGLALMTQLMLRWESLEGRD